jgi:outer membrane protein OmpA-like peptidoglycan-associated protein
MLSDGHRPRRRQVLILATALAAPTTARAASPDAGAFVLHDADGGAKAAHGSKASQIKATKTGAAMKFIVVDKDKGPIKGVVVTLTTPEGTTYFTDETDAEGYAEVLVPVGKKYDVAYLALGHRDITTTVTVSDEPKQNIKLTLRYKAMPPPPPFVLKGVTFDTARATIRPESLSLLDIVVDFMTRKKSARIEISGHTDNKGNRKTNKMLSAKRAEACRDYLIAHGIDGGRITAIGHGDERPMAPNDTEEGRQKNRRIEAREIVPPT